MAKDLGRHKGAREALVRGLFSALVKNGRIETSLARAKALKTFADNILSSAKKGDLAARRQLLQKLAQNETAVVKVFKEILPKMSNRTGGFTRIIKLGGRTGDYAPMARIEWVGGKKDASVQNIPTKSK